MLRTGDIIQYQCTNPGCKKVYVVPRDGSFLHQDTGRLGKEAGKKAPTAKVCPSCGKPVMMADNKTPA